jgi:hypothetical protein
VAAYARELGVEDGLVDVARELAAGSLDLAAHDFRRNGYEGTWNETASATAVHSARVLHDPWEFDVDDPELAVRWASLENLRGDSLGRKVWELYEARGFTFPGSPGSAPPLLAQHDWVHVLADYGTTVESEVEVFGLIARANDDLHAFSLLAMVLSLFETGYLARGAGLFEASPGHFSSSPHMAVRLSDAMRRGALAHDAVTGSDSIDFLGMDWFEVPPVLCGPARALQPGPQGGGCGGRRFGRALGAGRHQSLPAERRPGAGRLAVPPVPRPRCVGLTPTTRGIEARPAPGDDPSRTRGDRAWRRCWPRASRPRLR